MKKLILSMLFVLLIFAMHYTYKHFKEERIKEQSKIFFENYRTELLLQYDIQNLELNKIIDNCKECRRTKKELILSGDFPCENF